MTPSHQIHPGHHLAEIIDELDISQYRLAKTMDVPPGRINEIIHGRRAISPDTSVRLGKALGTSPDYWGRLQNQYDTYMAGEEVDLERIDDLSSRDEEPDDSGMSM